MVYLLVFVLLPAIWFGFPSDWRRNSDFRKRLKFCIYLQLYNLTINLQYMLYTNFLKKLQDSDYQPIAALYLILIREVNFWITSKFVTKMASGDEQGAQIVAGYYMAGRHGIHVCASIGGAASANTVYLLIAIDFLLNIYLAIKIVWLKKRGQEQIGQQIDLLQKLTLNELMEFVLPLGFLAAQAMVYYGPNCGIVLEACGKFWHASSTIENIWESSRALFWFFCMDFGSVILSGCILWVFAGINLLKPFGVLIKEFFLPLTFLPPYLVLTVNI